MHNKCKYDRRWHSKFKLLPLFLFCMANSIVKWNHQYPFKKSKLVWPAVKLRVKGEYKLSHTYLVLWRKTWHLSGSSWRLCMDFANPSRSVTPGVAFTWNTIKSIIMFLSQYCCVTHTHYSLRFCRLYQFTLTVKKQSLHFRSLAEDCPAILVPVMYFYFNQSAVTVWKKNTSDTDSTVYNYVKHSVSSLLFWKTTCTVLEKELS